mmetsp:Transcript_25013/g.26097  ORF Transcript_25013/g.26097 Transcript_25013/m.26097 type:complete len:81 (-) Transcript_25013:114-356(-)
MDSKESKPEENKYKISSAADGVVSPKKQFIKARLNDIRTQEEEEKKSKVSQETKTESRAMQIIERMRKNQMTNENQNKKK